MSGLPLKHVLNLVWGAAKRVLETSYHKNKNMFQSVVHATNGILSDFGHYVSKTGSYRGERVTFFLSLQTGR